MTSTTWVLARLVRGRAVYRIVWLFFASGAAIAVFPTTTSAQPPASTFDELRLLVKDGNQLVVTDSNGRRTRGKLVTLTASSVDLGVEKPRFLFMVERSTMSFTDAAVTTITRIDSTREGVLIGLLAGYLSGTVPTCSGGASLDCDYALILGGPFFGVIGSAVGWFIDARMNKIVYRTGRDTRPAVVTLSPLLNPRAAGGSFSVRF